MNNFNTYPSTPANESYNLQPAPPTEYDPQPAPPTKYDRKMSISAYDMHAESAGMPTTAEQFRVQPTPIRPRNETAPVIYDTFEDDVKLTAAVRQEAMQIAADIEVRNNQEREAKEAAEAELMRAAKESATSELASITAQIQESEAIITRIKDELGQQKFVDYTSAAAAQQTLETSPKMPANEVAWFQGKVNEYFDKYGTSLSDVHKKITPEYTRLAKLNARARELKRVLAS